MIPNHRFGYVEDGESSHNHHLLIHRKTSGAVPNVIYNGRRHISSWSNARESK